MMKANGTTEVAQKITDVNRIYHRLQDLPKDKQLLAFGYILGLSAVQDSETRTKQ